MTPYPVLPHVSTMLFKIEINFKMLTFQHISHIVAYTANSFTLHSLMKMMPMTYLSDFLALFIPVIL